MSTNTRRNTARRLVDSSEEHRDKETFQDPGTQPDIQPEDNKHKKEHSQETCRQFRGTQGQGDNLKAQEQHRNTAKANQKTAETQRNTAKRLGDSLKGTQTVDSTTVHNQKPSRTPQKSDRDPHPQKPPSPSVPGLH
jgi:hypothetical protein